VTTNNKPNKAILLAQATYYFLAAAWPLIHLTSFLSVTGAKTDIWLLKTVSLLIMVPSLTFFYAAFRKTDNLLIALIGFTSAIFLGFVDVYYYSTGVISWVYLIDVIPEAIFALYWAVFAVSMQYDQ
jgi:hypothetical protein